MRFSFAMIPSTQLIAKDFAASPKSRILYKTFLIIKGLKTLISKCPLLPPTVIATLFPITWQHTMVKASH